MEDCLDSSPETSKGNSFTENCHDDQCQLDGEAPNSNDTGSNQPWSSYENYSADDMSLPHYGHYQIPPRKTFDHIKDKELRKKLKNRESAQAARDRKKAKMIFLEARVSELAERNRYLQAKNENLLKYIMHIKARAGILHEDSEEEMAIYKTQYHTNTSMMEGNRNLAMNEYNGLPYSNGAIDQDTYPGGTMQSEGGNRLGMDLRNTSSYQHGYSQQ